jgi:hypothetical protein
MNGFDHILHPDISIDDRITSSDCLKQLKHYVTSVDRSLVFFVGAGASAAGNTNMPGTPDLIRHLLVSAIQHSASADSKLIATLGKISTRLGFEITLNDLWQICPQAVTLLIETFADLEARCRPNRAHTFLAHWISTGGTVITTNYDRLIERKWKKISQSIRIRYQEHGLHFTFANWQADLAQGGCLFKIHGSFDNPDSCLAALEHVQTELDGYRAELLREIVRTRPLCFVGWSGVDPDIPPLLFHALEARDDALCTFWIHYEGHPPGSVSLDEAIQNMSPLIRSYASNKPILTDADRAFGQILDWCNLLSQPNPKRIPEELNFSSALNHCSSSGATRMVSIALRRANEFDFAARILDEALKVAQTAEEHSAALQELALLQQQITGKNTDQSRQLVFEARASLGSRPDPWLQLNTSFGQLSLTIITLQSRPWLIVKIPGLFRCYRQDIETLREQTTDKESVALHESLFHLYRGRLRFKLLGWLATFIHPLADWILDSFNIAYTSIDDAKNIHLHSRIDVLAYRVAALAYLGRCHEALSDIAEIDRLVAILKDDARTEHWEQQKSEISRKCESQ